MDERRFDDIVYALAGSAPRRAALRTLTATALGGLLARLGVADALARCRRPGARCERSGDCCTGAVCKRGRCRCKAGRDECGGRCCAPSQRCVDGVCRTPPRSTCPADTVLCSNTSRCEAAGAATPCQCGKTTAGAVVCLATGRGTNHICADCLTDDDCAQHGRDFLCVPNGCSCGTNACIRWCQHPA